MHLPTSLRFSRPKFDLSKRSTIMFCNHRLPYHYHIRSTEIHTTSTSFSSVLYLRLWHSPTDRVATRGAARHCLRLSCVYIIIYYNIKILYYVQKHDHTRARYIYIRMCSKRPVNVIKLCLLYYIGGRTTPCTRVYFAAICRRRPLYVYNIIYSMYTLRCVICCRVRRSHYIFACEVTR